MTEQKHEETKSEDNPWQAFSNELEQLPEGPLPKVSGMSIRRKSSAVEQWAQSFLRGSIPVYFLAFVAMALLCPPKEDPLGLFLSTLILFPLTWLFRPVLFHGRRGSRLSYAVGAIYLGLVSGISTIAGSELARKLVDHKFEYQAPDIYALRFQRKIEFFFSPGYLLFFLAMVCLTLLLLSKLKKKFVWLDQENPRAAVVFLCLSVSTLLPLAGTGILIYGSAWTAEEEAWLTQAQQTYGERLAAAESHSSDSPWSQLLDDAEKQGYKQYSPLSEPMALKFTSRVLSLWKQPGSLSDKEVGIVQGFSNALLNSPNPHPRRLDLARVLLKLQFDYPQARTSFLSQAALIPELIPYLAKAPLSEIEEGGWERDLSSWKDDAKFDLESVEFFVYSYMVRELNLSKLESQGKDLPGEVGPLHIFGQEFTPSPTQMMARYRVKDALKTWQEVKRQYQELKPRERRQSILQRMAEEGDWKRVQSDLYYVFETLNLIPPLEVSLFIIEARRQHDATGKWPVSREGIGWSYDRNELRVLLKSGPDTDLTESHSWVLE